MAELTVPGGAMIGFSANKTEAEAIEQKNTAASAGGVKNRMVICKEKTLYMNGERLGLSDSEADYLKRKLNEEFASKVSMDVSLSKNIQDAAAPTSVTVTVKTYFNKSLVDADAVPTITATGMSPKLTKTATGTYTCTLEGKNTHVTVSVTAKIKGITRNYSGTIYSYYKIRYGVSALDVIPASGPIPEAFKAVGPQGSAAGTYSFTFTDNTYGYILVPNGVSLPKSMQGDNPSGVENDVTPVPFKKLANVVVGGVTYTQLRIATKQLQSTHNVKFA